MKINIKDYQKLFDLNDEMDVLRYIKEHLKHQNVSHESVTKWIHAIHNTLTVLAECNSSVENESVDEEAIEFISTTNQLIVSVIGELQNELNRFKFPLTFHAYYYVLYKSTSLQYLVRELQLVVTMELCINPLMSLYVRSIDTFTSIISGEPIKLKALSNC